MRRVCAFCDQALDDPVSLDALTRGEFMHPACNERRKTLRLIRDLAVGFLIGFVLVSFAVWVIL